MTDAPPGDAGLAPDSGGGFHDDFDAIAPTALGEEGGEPGGSFDDDGVPEAYALSAAVNGTMTFTVDRGYAGDGSTGYVSTVTNDNAWSKFSQNSMAFGVYLNVNATSGLVIGQITGTTLRMSPTTGTNMQSRVGSNTSLSGANTIGTGLFVSNRSDSANIAIYRNGGSIATSASNTSLALAGEPLLVNRGATAYSTARAAAIILGSSLDATKQTSLNTRLNSYLTAIGAA